MKSTFLKLFVCALRGVSTCPNIGRMRPARHSDIRFKKCAFRRVVFYFAVCALRGICTNDTSQYRIRARYYISYVICHMPHVICHKSRQGFHAEISAPDSARYFFVFFSTLVLACWSLAIPCWTRIRLRLVAYFFGVYRSLSLRSTLLPK